MQSKQWKLIGRAAALFLFSVRMKEMYSFSYIHV